MTDPFRKGDLVKINDAVYILVIAIGDPAESIPLDTNEMMPCHVIFPDGHCDLTILISKLDQVICRR
jgi:hypothetical protein